MERTGIVYPLAGTVESSGTILEIGNNRFPFGPRHYDALITARETFIPLKVDGESQLFHLIRPPRGDCSPAREGIEVIVLNGTPGMSGIKGGRIRSKAA